MKTFCCLFLTAVVLLPATTFGQDKSAEDKYTDHITLHPAAVPRPAMRYQLLPPFLVRRPGNAAVLWNQIPVERPSFIAEFAKVFQPPYPTNTWQEIAIGDPREKEYRRRELSHIVPVLEDNNVFNDMERAARFESCDWQLPVREGNFARLPFRGVSQMRDYARWLNLRAHLEIAEGRYDQAVRTFQVGYAEARQVAQGQTLVHALVGEQIACVMSEQVQQFIQQPDAPNLYWALSTLPRPLIDFRPGFETESNGLYLQYPELRDLEKKKLSADEWRAMFDRIVRDLSEIASLQRSSRKATPAPAIASTAYALDAYPQAKRSLIESGCAAAEVETMPVAQVVLLYMVRRYNDLSDERSKWFFLPAVEAGDNVRQQSPHAASEPMIVRLFCELFLGPGVKHVENRCQRTVAMLRICEAMRMYAAGHNGRWPDRLGDITEVPIPTNPIDGEPFVYQRQGNRATLTSEKWAGMPRRYEMTLVPKAK